MSKEPQSALEATKRLKQILDVNDEKANPRDIVKNNCTHLSAPEQSLLLELLQDFEELFDGTLVTGIVSQSSSNCNKEHSHTMASHFRCPKSTWMLPKRKSKVHAMWEYYNDKLTQNGLCQPL